MQMEPSTQTVRPETLPDFNKYATCDIESQGRYGRFEKRSSINSTLLN
jgi:hypothetical protein